MDNDRLTLTWKRPPSCRALGYELVARGELPHVRPGRRIVVPRRALDDLLDVGSLESA